MNYMHELNRIAARANAAARAAERGSDVSDAAAEIYLQIVEIEEAMAATMSARNNSRTARRRGNSPEWAVIKAVGKASDAASAPDARGMVRAAKFLEEAAALLK